MVKTNKKISQIESLCATDVGRNISELAKLVAGDLFLAAESIVNQPEPKIAIVTGFYIPQVNPPAPESDGMTGAVLMAKAFSQIGIPVDLITDENCKPALQTALGLINNNIRLLSVPLISSQTTIEQLSQQWRQESKLPTHIIYIERVGPDKRGDYHNMSGMKINQWSAPLHLLMAINHSMVSIGMGDGGNEIGMGKIPYEIISNNIKNGSTIACVVPCDFLIVAGVSNWGATALLAAILLLNKKWKEALLTVLTSNTEYEILCQLSAQKLLVDGVTKLFEPTVDGLTWDVHFKVIQQMIRVACH